MKRILAAAAIVFAAAVSLTGCSTTGSSYQPMQYSQVCMTPNGIRVVDALCVGATHIGYGWMYLPMTTRIPAVGQKSTFGTKTLPKGGVSAGHAPTTGLSITKPSTTGSSRTGTGTSSTRSGTSSSTVRSGGSSFHSSGGHR